MAPRPHLATALDIEQWADSLEARGELPRLVRRLIRQTNDQVTLLDVRAAEATGASGYDGLVEAPRGTPLVPEGKSVWEIGTGNDPAKKANEDYSTRTADPLGVDPGETTFVFVTCRRWDGKRDWEDAKRNEGKWKNVRAFDVQDIETALEAALAAHIWLSELLNKPVSGVESMEQWWSRFSNSTLPTLSPELVLSDRVDEAASLLRIVEEDPRIVTISASSQDDVIAFVGAVLLTSPEERRADLLARTLIVRDAYTLLQLDQVANLLILVPFEEDLRRDALLVRSHHVVLIAEEDTPADIPLPAIAIEPAISVLRGMGVDEDRATQLAQAANRSLVAFQREAPASPGAARRDWSAFFGSKEVRRAWLIGGWTEQRSGDIDVLSALLGVSYDDARDALLKLARGPDPLFTVTGEQWARVLPQAALAYGQSSISRGDLEAVEKAIQDVLGAVDPALELPVEERWRASIQGKERIHSSTLRNGLATTLALLGSFGGSIHLGNGRTGQTWANSVVSDLLMRANADPSGQLWASLSDVLPLLGEAAPDVFLRGVQEGLGEEPPVLRHMFLDYLDAGVLSVSSPHTGLLWALEALAWSPEHLSLVSELLAKLAEIDPGGRLSNRPRSTLATIFRTWLPQTSASADVRTRVIDALSRRHDRVGWELLLDLLPEFRAVGSYSYAPSFRSWKPEIPGVTQKERWDVTSAVIERAIELAGTNTSRWAELVDRLSDFPPEHRREAFDRLTLLADDGTLSDEDKKEIWNAIETVVRHHSSFADTKWAMAPDDTKRLSEIGERFKPHDSVATNLWLFGSFPELGEVRRSNFKEYEQRLQDLREKAVRSLLGQEGIGGLVRIAEAAESPWSVGYALAGSDVDVDELSLLDLLDSSDPRRVELALGFAGARGRQNWAWIESALARFKGRPIAQARILRMSDDLTRAWALARELGNDVENEYWREFVYIGRGKEFHHVNEVADRLLEHGRVAAAIDFLTMYSHENANDVDPELAARALEALIVTQGKDPESSRVASYEIETLLEFVRPRIDEERAGLLEWRLLPGLGSFAASPLLHRRLARDPGFFVEILSLCFRPREGESEREVPPAVASNAWHLLQQWQIVPGSDEVGGAIDESQLRQWIHQAREVALEVRRQEVADNYIGQVFAHARGDEDGTWPTQPVRNAIEEIASPDLEDGVRTGIYNKRGVWSRSLTEGGRQERDLSKTYRAYEALIRERWPRTAAVLRTIAEGYEIEARGHDEEAERILKGVDR